MQKRKLYQRIPAILLLVLPPFLLSAGFVGFEVMQNYNGICPGIMDTPPYACSVWEFIVRNTFSPFALPFHVLIFIGWFIPVLLFFVLSRLLRQMEKNGTGSSGS